LRAEDGAPPLRIELSEYLDSLYGYAVTLSRDQTNAEDLVQETCLRAIGGMGRLRPDSNVKSWLFTILRNIWLNQVRQWNTMPQVVELDLDGSDGNGVPSTSNDPHANYVSKLERDQVRAAIQQLPLEFREIVILRQFEELSYQEIATILDCPPGTVMSRLARARARLRDLLAPLSMVRPQEENQASNNQETAA